MLVTNQTTQDLYFGPLHLPAGVGQQITVDDTTDTSLYLSNDVVADALNNAYNAAKVTVSGQALPFPRPTGTPELVHGDGTPEGIVYAPRGSVYMRRDADITWVLYIKTTPVTQSTGWVAVDTTGASVPTGSISAFAGINPPSGWLRCDGTAYSQTSYAALFAALVANKGTVTVTIASPAVFTLTNHGLVAGDIVYVETTGALPTGLSPDTPYYVIASGLSSNAFELSTSRGGSAINTSGSQSGTHALYYAPYANSNMTAGSFTVPDMRGRVAVGYAPSGGHADVSTLGNNDGVAEQYRRPKHRHTVSGGSQLFRMTGGITGSTTGTTGQQVTVAVGADTTNDPLDAPAWLTVNHIIKI